MPHPVIYSSETGKGHGFGPKTGEFPFFPGLRVPGEIHEEQPYENGKPKPEYQCTTRSTNRCVEDCYNKELPFAKAGPPNYSVAPKFMGGYQCNDWAEDIIAMCEAKCKGQGK